MRGEAGGLLAIGFLCVYFLVRFRSIYQNDCRQWMNGRKRVFWCQKMPQVNCHKLGQVHCTHATSRLPHRQPQEYRYLFKIRDPSSFTSIDAPDHGSSPGQTCSKVLDNARLVPVSGWHWPRLSGTGPGPADQVGLQTRSTGCCCCPQRLESVIEQRLFRDIIT